MLASALMLYSFSWFRFCQIFIGILLIFAVSLNPYSYILRHSSHLWTVYEWSIVLYFGFEASCGISKFVFENPRAKSVGSCNAGFMLLLVGSSLVHIWTNIVRASGSLFIVVYIDLRAYQLYLKILTRGGVDGRAQARRSTDSNCCSLNFYLSPCSDQSKKRRTCDHLLYFIFEVFLAICVRICGFANISFQGDHENSAVVCSIRNHSYYNWRYEGLLYSVASYFVFGGRFSRFVNVTSYLSFGGFLRSDLLGFWWVIPQFGFVFLNCERSRGLLMLNFNFSRGFALPVLSESICSHLIAGR